MNAIDMRHSLNSGQAFLWERMEQHWYVVDGQDVLRISDSGSLESYAGNNTDYLRSTDDIDGMMDRICRDPVIAGAAKRWGGLRLLRQDPFQCMVSFIASANSSIPRIRSCLERLTMKCGETTLTV